MIRYYRLPSEHRNTFYRNYYSIKRILTFIALEIHFQVPCFFNALQIFTYLDEVKSSLVNPLLCKSEPEKDGVEATEVTRVVLPGPGAFVGVLVTANHSQ